MYTLQSAVLYSSIFAFQQGRLLDVKLAGEGGVVRAHRVILAAASAYFEDLLADCTDHLPTIFFRSGGKVQCYCLTRYHEYPIRDVAVLDLEKIVQYIYTGDCQVDCEEISNNHLEIFSNKMFKETFPGGGYLSSVILVPCSLPWPPGVHRPGLAPILI